MLKLLENLMNIPIFEKKLGCGAAGYFNNIYNKDLQYNIHNFTIYLKILENTSYIMTNTLLHEIHTS